MNARYISLIFLASLMLPLGAQAADGQPPTPRVVVTGEGEAAAAPDMAIITLAVMREAETARAALDANNDAMAAVIAAIRETGVADRDLQTAGLQINPRYVYPQSGDQQPRLVAHQVTNTLTVRVRDIARVGEILDMSVSLGVNQGGTISFVNDDASAVMDEARKRAVADAMQRARTLAEAAGVSLGRILELSEQGFAPPPMPLGASAMRMEMDAKSVPVEAGENSYRVRVSVTLELEQ